MSERPKNGVYEPYEDVLVSLLWDDMDRARLSRAMARTTAALTWVLLALVGGSSFWWAGLPMLIVTCLSILHARRIPLLRLGGRAGNWLRRLMPYNDSPQFNAITVVDAAVCLITGVLLGGSVNVLSRGASADEVASILPAEYLLYSVVIAAGVMNVPAHLSWELHKPSGWLLKVRPVIGPFFGGLLFLVLFPYGYADDAEYRILILASLLGWIGTIATCLYGQRDLSSGVVRRRVSAAALRRRVRRADARHFHQVKNHVRGIDEALNYEDPSLPFLRQRVQFLWTTVVATEALYKADKPVTYRGASEAMRTLVDEGIPRYAEFLVTEDLDPATVPPSDRELIWLTVTDLTANAKTAKASRFVVSVTSELIRNNRWIELRAVCHCDSRPSVTATGSLYQLQLAVERMKGVLSFENGDGQHAFVVRWPTLGDPKPRRSV